MGWPPDIAMHLALTPAGWIWSFVADGGATLTPVKAVNYRDYTPDTARQRVEVVIDAHNSRAWVTAPDGVVAKFRRH